jgi:hypothetical protein
MRNESKKSMNYSRAGMGSYAISAYVDVAGSDPADDATIIDCIVDILHFAKQQRLRPLSILKTVEMHYEAER